MRGVPEVFNDFRSGVNLAAAPYSLDINQARDALNVRTSPSGAIVKRLGCNPLSTPSVVLQSLFGVRLATQQMIAQGGTKFFRISTGGTITELETEVTPTENVAWEFIQAPLKEAKGPIYGVNGTDTNIYWDGVTGKVKKWEGGGVPKGKYIAYHENRVYIAKESTLYWSEITNPFNFESPNGGSTKLDPEDGQEITGLGKCGPYLLIFKNRKTFMLTDSNNGYYRRISDEIGCGSNRSIVETEQGTFFLDNDNNIVVTDGINFNYQVGENIAPLLETITGASRIKVCGVKWGSSIYFSFSRSGSSNDYILEYDLLNKSWWPGKITYETGVTGGVNQFALLDPSSEAVLYATGANSTSKRFFKMFEASRWTDGAVYPCEWKSPWLVFSAPHVNKRIRSIRVDALGDFDLYSYNSFSSTAQRADVIYWESTAKEELWESETEGKYEEETGKAWGGEAVITERRYPSLGVGRAWSFRFLAETGTDLEIYSYTVAAQQRRD